MPLYVYSILDESNEPIGTFEVLQAMGDEPLTAHPETGQPVRRLIGLPNAPRKWGEGNMRSNLSPSNLERLGFTQYTKAGGGMYEKTAGTGPDVISADQ